MIIGFSPKSKEAMNMMNSGKTQTFSVVKDKSSETKQILREIYIALSEKGYDPINQIVGYLLSEDPTYITNHKNARAVISKLDRDKALNTMVKMYLGIK